jgi:hypothetical protein
MFVTRRDKVLGRRLRVRATARYIEERPRQLVTRFGPAAVARPRSRAHGRGASRVVLGHLVGLCLLTPNTEAAVFTVDGDRSGGGVKEVADGSGGGGRGSSERRDRSSSCDLSRKLSTASSKQKTWDERGPAVGCPRGFGERRRPGPELVRLEQHRRRQSPRLDTRRCSSVSSALLARTRERPSRYAPPDRRSRPVFAPLQKPGVRLTAHPLSVARCGVDTSSEHSSRATECSTTRANSEDAVATAWSCPHHGRQLLKGPGMTICATCAAVRRAPERVRRSSQTKTLPKSRPPNADLSYAFPVRLFAPRARSSSPPARSAALRRRIPRPGSEHGFLVLCERARDRRRKGPVDLERRTRPVEKDVLQLCHEGYGRRWRGVSLLFARWIRMVFWDTHSGTLRDSENRVSSERPEKQDIDRSLTVLLPTSYSYLTPPDFVSAVAPEGDFAKISREQYALLFKVADRRKCGRVNFDDFVAFEEVLKKPAAEFDVR